MTLQLHHPFDPVHLRHFAPRTRGNADARPKSMWMPRYYSLLLVCVVADACDRVKPDQSLDLYVVQPVNEPFIELQSNGLAVAPSPPMYQSSEPSFPIETVVSEGIDVKPGDPLMTLSAKEADNWSVKSMYGIKHNEAKLRFNRAKVGKKATGLELQRENIERQIAILEAQIQATRRQDGNQIQITEFQVKRTIETLNAAELHLTRLRALEPSMVSQRQ